MPEEVETDVVEAATPTVEVLLEEINDLKLKTVSKEEYNKLLEDNKKLVKEVTENRPMVIPNENKEPTRADIIQKCQERTNTLDKKDTLGKVTSLVQNYDDMVKLGMDVSQVDKQVVAGLKSMIEESKGDTAVFESLMNSRIKPSKI